MQFHELDYISNPVDPAIESNVKINPGKSYVLYITNNPKLIDLTPYLLSVLGDHYGRDSRDIEPIAVMPIRPKEDQRYVLVNEQLKKLMFDGAINEYGLLSVTAEQMNRQASSSEYLNTLIEDIISQQPDLFVSVFKNSSDLNLEANYNEITVLAPKAEVVEHFDDKIIQRGEVVEKLDLPVPRSFIAKGIDELVELYNSNFKNEAFVMCSHSRAGIGAQVVNSEKDILESPKLREDERYIISDFLNLELSPSTLGVVAEDGVYVAGLSDQIMDGVHFLGAISPSEASSGDKELMISLTETIGEYMAEQAYRGPFGVDYMIDTNGDLYFVEVNPRFIGSTAELTRTHIKVNPNAPSIPEMVYNGVVHNSLGFDPKSCRLPQLSWGYKSVKGKAGQRTDEIKKTDSAHTDVLDYPGRGIILYTDTTVGRVVYRDNPTATRQEILDTLNQRVLDIKLI